MLKNSSCSSQFALAMEYATGLLLAENAFAGYSSLATDFPAQVDAMLERLDAAQANRAR